MVTAKGNKNKDRTWNPKELILFDAIESPLGGVKW